MNKVTIREDVCKGCGLCVSVCPRKYWSCKKRCSTQRGAHPAGVTEPEKCIACAMCATMCPDVAIKVEKE